ncbi:MAG TPA: NAD-dependent epimerase/dehydratase family protein [Solirubrobacterales bacterium]|jgi:dihydroflavonol-4-reductase|nr:NAD-dependent epimerase/dehydratase family protein [Solirubrobacterales bacterium]
MEGGTGEKKTVLVTGGSGFLGGWCAVELLRGGHKVRTTVRDLGREAEVRAAIATEVAADDRLTVLAADLRSDDGWDAAVAGCSHVLHVASPFPPAQPKDPEELIVPAREGTLRVLGASLDAGVERIVLTSSVAAVTGGRGRRSTPLTEADWSDPDNPKLSPYARSKTIAERAAWDFVRERGAMDKLVAVNPGAIVGPLLSPDRSFSLQVIERLLRGMPGVPRIGFSFVDVRDIVDLELRAMAAPEAGGERFIAVTEFVWMREVAEILRERLGEDAAKVPTRSVPDLLVRAMALFDPSVRSILGQLGKRTELTSEKARGALGWSPRPVEDTVAECARSLLRHDVV